MSDPIVVDDAVKVSPPAPKPAAVPPPKPEPARAEPPKAVEPPAAKSAGPFPPPKPPAAAPTSWLGKLAESVGVAPTKRNAAIAASAALSLVAGIGGVRMLTSGGGTPPAASQPLTAQAAPTPPVAEQSGPPQPSKPEPLPGSPPPAPAPLPFDITRLVPPVELPWAPLARPLPLFALAPTPGELFIRGVFLGTCGAQRILPETPCSLIPAREPDKASYSRAAASLWRMGLFYPPQPQSTTPELLAGVTLPPLPLTPPAVPPPAPVLPDVAPSGSGPVVPPVVAPVAVTPIGAGPAAPTAPGPVGATAVAPLPPPSVSLEPAAASVLPKVTPPDNAARPAPPAGHDPNFRPAAAAEPLKLPEIGPASPSALPPPNPVVPASGQLAPPLPVVPVGFNNTPPTPPSSPGPATPLPIPMTPPSGPPVPAPPAVGPAGPTALPALPTVPPTGPSNTVPPPADLGVKPAAPGGPGPMPPAGLPAVPTAPPGGLAKPEIPGNLGVGPNPASVAPTVPTPPGGAAPPPPLQGSPVGGTAVAPSLQPEPPGKSLQITKPADSATPAPLPGPAAPAGGNEVRTVTAERPARTSFDVDLYEPRAGDTYDTIAREFYTDARYARALQEYNARRPVHPGRSVDVPPIAILRQRYSGMIGTPTTATPASRPGTGTAPAGEWGPANAPKPAAGGDPTFRPASGGGPQTFRVPPGGMSLKAVARQTLGSDQRWNELYELNPQVADPNAVPAFTTLKLPADARASQ